MLGVQSPVPFFSDCIPTLKLIKHVDWEICGSGRIPDKLHWLQVWIIILQWKSNLQMKRVKGSWMCMLTLDEKAGLHAHPHMVQAFAVLVGVSVKT